jgi:ABC-2 type transport system permease protein
VLVGFGCLAFGMRVSGSPITLMCIALVGALSFAGLGLLVASRAQNTQTVGGLMNLVMMPMSVGSGVFFSTANFPDVMQPLLRALPLTALNDGLRAVINEGAGIRQSAPALGVLAAWGFLSFAAALKLFRWR